jgi:hypothetical protein
MPRIRQESRGTNRVGATREAVLLPSHNTAPRQTIPLFLNFDLERPITAKGILNLKRFLTRQRMGKGHFREVRNVTPAQRIHGRKGRGTSPRSSPRAPRRSFG